MKIIDYKLVRAGLGESLENEVKKTIAEGWQPFGTPFLFSSCSGMTLAFYQAMVKYEAEIKDAGDWLEQIMGIDFGANS